MLSYILRRLSVCVLTLIFASLIIFWVTEILPGDAALVSSGIHASEELLAAKREALGLNRPAWVRYIDWAIGFVQGDLGQSLSYHVPVAQLLSDRIYISLPLAVFALFLSIILAVPFGFLAALYLHKWPDFLVQTVTQFGIALPNFWLALLLISVFSVGFGWLPAGGFDGWENGILAGFSSLLLPAFSLALPQAAILARVLRGALLDCFNQDYMRTARAKGMTEKQALWRHGVRNALVPVLTILGLQFAFLVSGTVIIENVFYLPGIGSLVFQAIRQSDVVTVQSIVLLLVGMVVAVNFFVDLAYGWVDPRIRSRHAKP